METGTEPGAHLRHCNEETGEHCSESMFIRALPLGLVLSASLALADSPLTSTDFATAYGDVPQVQRAKDGELAAAYEFLSGPASTDQKLAVANALGWQGDFASGFFKHLAQRRDVKPEQLDVKDLSPSQQFVAGYLVAMADYLDLKPLKPGASGVWGKTGLFLLDRAAGSLKDDFTVQYTRSLVKAQKAMSGNWCEVFRIPNDVLKRFPAEQRNLRAGAVEAAQGYLAGYEESCADTKAAARVEVDQLNQAYSLSRLGAQVVVGTQGGVVVWDPSQEKPIAKRRGFICRGLTWKNAAWLGCEAEVVRWDGTRFSSFLPRSKKGSSEYYVPMEGPDGKLWVRLGKKTFEYDEAGHRFAPVNAPWSGDPYDAFFFEGQAYWIDFLSALHAGPATFTPKSAQYPGSDPRAFRVDSRGTLWVEDFESGAFRLESGRFVKQPGLDQKSTGVAYDVERKRLWLLHYTKGLVLIGNGTDPERVDLPELENMRALLLDPASGDVWVAGWTQLVRVRADGPTWVKQRFQVK